VVALFGVSFKLIRIKQVCVYILLRTNTCDSLVGKSLDYNLNHHVDLTRSINDHSSNHYQFERVTITAGQRKA
jgi:hypothetical protein